MIQMTVRNKLLIRLFVGRFWPATIKTNLDLCLMSPCLYRRCCIWRGRGRRNYSGFMAGGLLDCHQLVLWRERSRSAAVGFFWRVHPNVCTKNCGRFSRDWSTSGVTSYDCRYRNSSKHTHYDGNFVFIIKGTWLSKSLLRMMSKQFLLQTTAIF